MRVIQRTIYNYDELEGWAQKYALEKFREEDRQLSLPEDMKWEAMRLLEEAGIEAVLKDVRVLYSLGYCQGDGAIIELVGSYKGNTVKVEQFGHYSHEYSTRVDMIDPETSELLDCKGFEENVYVPLCRELRDFGYSCIEERQKRSYIESEFKDYDVEFYSNGETFV